MKKTNRFVGIGMAVGLSLSCGAAWAGAGDYLVPISGTWQGAQAFSNATDHAIGDIPAHALGPWQPNAVFQATGVNLQDRAAWQTNEVYQIDWTVGRRILETGTGGQIRLGAGGIVSHTWGNGPIRLLSPTANPPGELRLVASQTWHNNNEPNAGLSVSTDQDNGDNTMRVVADPGVTLTLREKVTLSIGVDTEFGGDIVIRDTSSITLADGKSLKAGRVTLSGLEAKVVFGGAVSLFAHELALADGASFVAAGQVWDVDMPLVVSSGECTLAGRLLVAGDRLKVDVAAGATLVMSAAVVSETTGEPVTVENVGTGSLDLRVINVGNVPVSDGRLVVQKGQTLNVTGDGLTSATTVELAGGILRAASKVVTIASPVVVTAEAADVTNKIEVSSGCEARFVGGLAHTGEVAAPLVLAGGGTKVFTSDVSFANGCRFVHAAGDVVVSNSVWTANGVDAGKLCNNAVTASAGRFLFGANSKLTGSFLVVSVSVDDTNVDGGILEFAEGSEFFLSGAGQICVMTTTTGRGTLRVSGGYLHAKNAQGFLEIGNHAYGRRARLEFLSGIIECTSSIVSRQQPYSANYAHAVFDWKGGTLRANKGDNFSTYIGHFFSSATGVDAMEVIIDGPDCVLDVGHPNLDEISLCEDKSAVGRGMRWTCTERGLLTLTNATARAGRLVVHNAFTNMNLRVCANAGLRVDERTTVYPFSLRTVEQAAPGALANVLPESGVEWKAETLKGAAGVPLTATDLAGWTYEDLAFAEGGIYQFGVKGAGAVTLNVPGRLVLPSQMSFAGVNDAAGVGTSDVVIRAAGGIESPDGAVLAPLPGSRRFGYFLDGNAVRLECAGLLMVIR